MGKVRACELASCERAGAGLACPALPGSIQGHTHTRAAHHTHTQGAGAANAVPSHQPAHVRVAARILGVQEGGRAALLLVAARAVVVPLPARAPVAPPISAPAAPVLPVGPAIHGSTRPGSPRAARCCPMPAVPACGRGVVWVCVAWIRHRRPAKGGKCLPEGACWHHHFVIFIIGFGRRASRPALPPDTHNTPRQGFREWGWPAPPPPAPGHRPRAPKPPPHPIHGPGQAGMPLERPAWPAWLLLACSR